MSLINVCFFQLTLPFPGFNVTEIQTEVLPDAGTRINFTMFAPVNLPAIASRLEAAGKEVLDALARGNDSSIELDTFNASTLVVKGENTISFNMKYCLNGKFTQYLPLRCTARVRRQPMKVNV